MRLQSIKLSGFKSFANPTQFVLPGQLVGVVGPNGCGKSNIMDAVRWVLGESRASELRGESMQDVIFNGTTTRKPADRSSVELVFDNADHRASGPWGQFAEIAVRRVLTRDGNSSYFINSQLVRRRDVQDVFLGTGLGPRAYAIIGQGTISRIIESRPEELRLFLEEAAGVSKYKERRRETSSRLSDTLDNLTRVDDILRELNAQLERLEKQAEVALRYNALQASSTLKQHQLWFMRQFESLTEQTRIKTEGAAATLALEGHIADLRHEQAELETIRQAHFVAGQQMSEAQGLLYQASSEVARMETEIRFVVDGRTRVQQQLAALEIQALEWQVRAQDSDIELETLSGNQQEAEEAAHLLAAQVIDQAEGIQNHESLHRQSLADVQGARSAVALVQQQIQVLAAEQRSIAEQIRNLNVRREKLQSDLRSLPALDHFQKEAVAAQFASFREQQLHAENRLELLEKTLPEKEDLRRTLQSQSIREAALNTDYAARLNALTALQEKVKTEGKLAPWLQRQGLDGLTALWNGLRVQPGWESALEAALRERLGALQVSRLETLQGFAAGPAPDIPPARLAFFALPRTDDSHNSLGQAFERNPTLGLKALVDWLAPVEAGLQSVLAYWLHGCYSAKSLDEALDLQPHLLPGEAIYVEAGHAVMRHSISFYAPDSEQSGLMARAHEIENLHKQTKAQSLVAGQSHTAWVQAEALLNETAVLIAQTRRNATEAQVQAHRLQVELLRLTQLHEQAQSRSNQLETDLQELDFLLESQQERAMEAEGRFEGLDLQLADQQERQAQLEDRANLAERQLLDARAQQRQVERQAQDAQFAQRSLVVRQDELVRVLDMAQQQTRRVAQSQVIAQQELARLGDAAAHTGLQQALEQKLHYETLLTKTRLALDELAHDLRNSDQKRLAYEHALEPLRQRITELQLKEQAARLGAEQFSQLLLEAQADTEAVAQSIQATHPRLSGLQGEIDRLQRDILSLGAVNLAALDELATARERKSFLDAQLADLNEAMATLQDAIKKIDIETRDLLRETFDSVNTHFGRMFPELFGGGNARLVMTGDEILDAGVQVLAQPPGKKNQTIHLLSGGEKALTAIALVFAIFQLNPAPFCLLDEVDAPLDDANTERYAKLVTAMSRHTQFLFISHNKIAMEMAEQLIGVTMQEQGVSRIVAVDMEAALGFAEAA